MKEEIRIKNWSIEANEGNFNTWIHADIIEKECHEIQGNSLKELLENVKEYLSDYEIVSVVHEKEFTELLKIEIKNHDKNK